MNSALPSPISPMLPSPTTPEIGFAPPTIDDKRYLKLPPDPYRVPITAEKANEGIESIAKGRAIGMLGTLAGRQDIAYTLEMARPEYETRVKIPSARDDTNMYDSAGTQLFNTDGTPKQWAKLSMKVGGFPKEEATPALTNIEGKELVYVDKGKQKKTGRGWLANKVFNFEDSKMNFMALEASVNALWGKIVDDTKNTGPDHKYRILWSEYNKEGGYWQDYKGKPLDEKEVRSMEHERKMAVANPAYIMACAKYEFTKREEEVRVGPEGTWVKLLNVMHQNMGLDPDNVLNALHVGLYFIRKTEDLTVKHTPIYYANAAGEKIDPSSMSQKEWATERARGSQVKMGQLSERAFVTEFATKFGQGDRRSGTGDVAVMANLAEELEQRLDSAGDNISAKNRRKYQNAAFIASRMRSVVNDSRMAPSVTGEADVDMISSGARTVEELAKTAAIGKRPEYPARIYSSAVANDHWREVATIIDRISTKHPIVLETNMREDIDTRGTVRTDSRP